ncbi:MAG: YdeI/OmpD-associated family protein [Chitinimonas sp.]|nr:YdeI/OmpD-associated family protein [Chitinimonas sp.]
MEIENLRYFATPADFRDWLRQHHATATVQWVGFYKKESGLPSISWPESVDEALCVGWIDGIRKRVDEVSYAIRFTPCKRSSIWSAINIGRVAELQAEGRMQAAGLAAFEARQAEKSVVYSYEREHASLTEGYLQQLQANPAAWVYFQLQAPWYQRSASWWVTSAKQEPTRQRRLLQLIADSAAGRPLAQFDRSTPSGQGKAKQVP